MYDCLYFCGFSGSWHGRLHLQSQPIEYLPTNLKVGGYLNLHGTQITELPEGLKVGGYIWSYGTPMAKTDFVKPKGVKGEIYV